MATRYRLLILMILLATLAGCRAVPARAPEAAPSPTLTATPAPSATPEPTVPPTRTPFPTPAEVAPEATFATVGAVAEFSGAHEVTGKAVVAGLQTLIIQAFSFDGKGPRVDIRLVRGEDYANPVAILVELEPRVYAHEMVFTRIPATAGPDTADSIAVYCPETGEVYAAAKFD